MTPCLCNDANDWPEKTVVEDEVKEREEDETSGRRVVAGSDVELDGSSPDGSWTLMGR